MLRHLKSALAATFTLDTRSVRLARIAIGLLVLADLAFRALDLEAFYTDAGVLPREALHLQAWSFTWSLHALSGADWFQAALFALTAAAAIAFTTGRQTKIAAATLWLLLTSLHARNPLLRDGQDDLFRVLLFWFIFLPSPQNPPRTILSAGTVGYISQICLIYWAGVAAKLQSPWWTEGTAVLHALSMSRYQTELAKVALEYPQTLEALTHLVLATELLLPLALFIPWQRPKLRTFTVATFIAMHLAFALFLRLGVFPYLSAASWLALLPGKSPADHHTDRRRAPTALAAAALLLILVLQFPALRARPLALAGVTLGLHQNWGVFAPNPVTPLVMSDGWFIVKDPATEKILFENVPNHRWRHYLANLRVTWPKGSPLADTIDRSRAAWAETFCRTTTASAITILYMNRPLGAQAEARPQELVLHEHRCRQ